ncbi:MAG: low molecular weight phosphotyrosine protein phosphatase [Aquabacterium sp.]|nr:MAG: low molecular weight phosphotyrosine protein phosphatase [Aquabacterium sp.]
MAAPSKPVYSIAMICMGNICRSPTAEAVLRHKLRLAGLDRWVDVSSAGTHDYHAGSPPDRRSVAHGGKRGYDFSGQKADHVGPVHFRDCDLLLAMDWDNLELLQERCPPEYQHKLKRLMEFAPEAGSDIVPDPYYGGPAAFDHVLDLVEAACDGLVAHLQLQLGERPRNA